MNHLLVLLITALLPATLFAWTAPTAAPPGNNVSAPVNIGSADQFKPGVIGANILNVYGASQYLNFGNTTGASGFGLRNNGGIIEIKNSSGSWEKISQKPWFIATGTSSWQPQSAATWLYPTELTTVIGNASSSFVPSTGLFTAPEAGLYFCYFQGYKSYSAANYHHTISTCFNPGERVCNGFGNWDYTLAGQGSAGYGGYDQSTSQMSGLYNLAQGEKIGFRMYTDQYNAYAYYPPYTRMGCAKL